MLHTMERNSDESDTEEVEEPTNPAEKLSKPVEEAIKPAEEIENNENPECGGASDEINFAVKTSKAANTISSFVIGELDDHNVGKYFAVFWPKPKAYYWGKLLKVFSADVDEDANEVEILFLKKVESSSDPSRVKWDWPAIEDKGIVDAKLCFAGPCLPNVTDSSRAKSFMTFALEAEVMRKFREISKQGF